MTQLVIVESPAKAKTINKYLGKDFKVLASYGHVRNLVSKDGGVDTQHNFDMHYDLIAKNAKHLKTIADSMKQADKLLLATDPDREGEAIAWHVYDYLKQRKLLKNKTTQRIVFHEITQKAIQDALANPRDVSMDLVQAQQARQALDYLVGYNLSPLLWRKVRSGLSAGRVQSPALRMIVEREIEIEKFTSQEYWTLHADLSHKPDFEAKLTHFQNEKLEQFSINTATQAQATQQTLEQAANGYLLVSKIEKKQRKRHPAAPFITSTLQQEAARKLGFTTQRTMRTAQQLYEGIDIGMGTVGLISYMRTDSVSLANEAIAEIRDLIKLRYGDDMLPKSPRMFKTKSKNAQEAHEAIRPTSAKRRPDTIKNYLTADQYKLYHLIWQRAIACQMIHATLDTVAIDLTCSDDVGLFRANGSVIKHQGFMSVYLEGKDDTAEEREKHLPELKQGEKITLKQIRNEQHFTEPPPRYSEASLVKTLEEQGIGRPSTYASIIYTLQHRNYVKLLQKRFHPTDVGRVVNKFLTEYFTQYVDYQFTANLEDDLDAIARGEQQRVPFLDHFWQPFTKQVTTINETVKRSDVTQEKLEEACPDCGKLLLIRLSRAGRFIGCSGFPDCHYTRSLENSAEEQADEANETRQCPDCGHDLVIKHGRYGKFYGCSNYPKCKHIEPLKKPKDTGVTCPQCKQGSLLEKKSRRDKVFYACSSYPDCKYALWNLPLAEACPKM